MIERHVNVLAAHCQRRLVEFHLAAYRQRKIPRRPRIHRLRQHHRALPVLQPRRIQSAPVRRIDRNLRIKLPRARFQHHPRSLPRLAVVIAGHQQHGRHATVLAIGHASVMRIENVNPSRTIGRHGRFPLIAAGQPHARLPGKLRRRRPSHRCQRAQQHDQLRNTEFGCREFAYEFRHREYEFHGAHPARGGGEAIPFHELYSETTCGSIAPSGVPFLGHILN